MGGCRRLVIAGGSWVRLTPTEAAIARLVAAHEGRPLSMAQMAAMLGRNEKTVARLVSHLRRLGLLACEAVHAESGAQMANSYRLSHELREWVERQR